MSWTVSERVDFGPWIELQHYKAFAASVHRNPEPGFKFSALAVGQQALMDRFLPAKPMSFAGLERAGAAGVLPSDPSLVMGR